jgi:probable rRNA maturation factor
MITIFDNKKLLKNSLNIPLETIKNYLEDTFDIKKDINIIFLSAKQIKKLNKEYRNKDEVTDILSFNIDGKNILGEIYICPEYIIKNTDKEDQQEQFLRILIHGILHLQGYDHQKKFRKVDYKDEAMYIEQEEKLKKILEQIKQK